MADADAAISYDDVAPTSHIDSGDVMSPVPDSATLPAYYTTDAEVAWCDLFEFVVCTVVIGIVCVIGAAGNILSFVVLFKHKPPTGAIFLLQSLAISDLLLLVATVFIYSLPAVFPYTGHLKVFVTSFDYVKKYVWPTAMMLHTATVWLTVLVTVDRYCAVCRAVQQYGTTTVKSTRIRVLVVVALSVLYNMPRFFEHQVIEVTRTVPQTGVNDHITALDLNVTGRRGDDGDDSSRTSNGTWSTNEAYSLHQNGRPPPVRNVSADQTNPDEQSSPILGDNHLYQIVYSNVLYYPVMYLIPLASLAYLNVKLIAGLKNVRRRASAASARHHATRADANSVVAPSAATVANGQDSNVQATAPSRRQHRRRGGGSRKDDNITQCVVAIVFVFIVCQTPALFNQIFWALFEPEERECGRFHFYYTKLSDVLVVVNSSCNFIVYCLFGRTFRRIFVATVCGCCGIASAAAATASTVGVAGGPATVGRLHAADRKSSFAAAVNDSIRRSSSSTYKRCAV